MTSQKQMTHNSLCLHQIDATLDDILIKLHAESRVEHTISPRVIKTWKKMNDLLWDTIHQQAAHSVVAIENGDPVSSFVELIGGSQSGGTRPDNHNLLSRTDFRRIWNDPAHLKALSKSRYGQQSALANG